MQSTYALDPHLAARLSEDQSALQGKRFVFASKDSKLVIMGKFASRCMLYDGPHGHEQVVSLEFENIDDMHILGLAITIVKREDFTEVRARLLVWDNFAPKPIEGSLSVLDDYASAENDRHNLRMFWLRAEPAIGVRGWNLLRYANAPIDLIGSSMRFVLASARGIPMATAQVIAISRVADARLVYHLRDAAGHIVEIHQTPTSWIRRLGKDAFEHVVVSFPVD